jgi:hypothetical protein
MNCFSRTIGTFTMLLALSGATQAIAQEQTVRVAFRQITPLEADPGSVVMAVLDVENLSQDSRRFQPAVELPSRWQLVFPEQPFTLALKASTVRFISLSVPAEAQAGPHTVRFTLTDSLAHRVLAVDSLTITVRSKRQVLLEVTGPPPFVAAGMPYEATVLVSNEGNVREEVTLFAAAEPGFSASPDSIHVSVGPFSTEATTVTVQTPVEVSRQFVHALRITGRTADGQALHASEALDVIPQVSRVSDPYRRLPVEASVGTAYESDVAHPQFSVTGGTGSVFSSSDRLDFVLRGPDQLRNSMLGEMDEYWLRYSATRYRLHAGDDVYTLSPLTEVGIRGMGARGDATLGRLSLGAYGHETRYYAPGEQQFGAYTSYSLLNGLDLGTNYLAKTGRLDGHLATLRVQAEPWTNVSVDAEAGADLAASDDNRAFSVNVRAQQGRLGVNGRWLRAGGNFASSYRSVDFLSGSARLQVASRLFLESSFFDQQRNAFSNPLLELDQRTRTLRVGARYSSLLSLFYHYNGYFENGDTERQDRAVQADVRIPLAFVSLSSRVEAGERAYRLLEDHFTYLRYDVSLFLNPVAGQSLQATFTHDLDRNPVSGEPQHRQGLNVSLGLNLNRVLRANAALTHSWYTSGVDARFTNADLLLSYTLPASHRITLRGRLLRFGQASVETDHALSLQYVIPLNMPLGRASSSGTIQGRIYDVTTGAGLENVLLKAGNQAVLSGKDGRYAFVGIPPDAYTLEVDRGSIGVDRTTAQPTPMQIMLDGGRSVEMDVGVTAAAVLSGQVARYTHEGTSLSAEGQLVRAGGQRGIIVEVTDGDEVQRRLTNAQGGFSFTNLRPGRWTLSVVQTDLSDLYFLEQDTVTLALSPGEHREVELRVLPVERTIRLVGGGDLTLGTSEPAEASEPAAAQTDRTDEVLRYHTVLATDGGLMNIARQVYDDAALWPKIWQANLDQIEHPDNLRTGIRLRIPPKAPLTAAEQAALNRYLAR